MPLLSALSWLHSLCLSRDIRVVDLVNDVRPYLHVIDCSTVTSAAGAVMSMPWVPVHLRRLVISCNVLNFNALPGTNTIMNRGAFVLVP